MSALSNAASSASAFFARFRRAPSASTTKAPSRFRFVGYGFYYVAAFLFFAYMTFPYDRVRDFVVHQVQAALPGAELDIVSLEPAWLSGVEARGVQLRFPAEPGAVLPPPGTRQLRPTVTLPYVYARVSILPLLFGTTAANFEVEVDGGGTIEGSFEETSSSTHVVAHLENVDLRRLGVIRYYAGFSVSGRVTGDVDLTVGEESDATTGTITLSIAETQIGDEQFQVPIPGLGAGLQLTRVDVGTLNLRIDVEHGQGRVQQLSGDGTDVVLRGAGALRLVRPIRMSSLDLLVRTQIQPAYLTRNPAVQGALEIAGANPMVAAYRAPDGAFQIRLQGTLGARMSVAPAGNASIPQ